MNNPTPACARDDLILHRLGQLENGIADIRDELRALVKLQTEMVEIQRQQSDLERRVRKVESELPTLITLRSWVFGAIGSAIAGVALGLFSLLKGHG